MSVVEVWHNVLWSRYKGVVFTALHDLAVSKGDDYRFFQMTQSERGRSALAQVDLSYHLYPYKLMYSGNSHDISIFRKVPRYFMHAIRSRADFVLISGFSESQNWAQLLGLMLRRKPRGVFCDSTIADRKQNVLKSIAKRFFFRRCDLVFCYGVRAREFALYHGARASSVVQRCQTAALPHDYDADKIPGARELKRSNRPRFLYVGRLAPEKNLERLLQAFSRVVEALPDAELRIVGTGPEQRSLEAAIASLGINQRVHLLGPKDGRNLIEELLEATCLVLPSLSEPWGLVVNEALAYGCPVAVSRACGCIPELVVVHETGLTFNPNSCDDITACLIEMQNGLGPARNVAERCLKQIKKYTPEAVAEQIHTAIKSHLNHGRGGETY